MKRFPVKSFVVIVVMFTLGCTSEPDPILFGVQECSHCRMTITEHAFASQLMTDKGRTHSFDAIECMMHYSKSNFDTHDEIRLFRVADQNPPHDLMDATQSVYVISPTIPSPMGGNLSAYRNREDASVRLGDREGHTMEWQDLVQLYNNR